MDLEQQRSWLCLAQQPYPLIREFLQQISTFNLADEADSLIEISLLIEPWLKSHKCKTDEVPVENALGWLEQSNHNLMCYPQFPEKLKTIKDPPALLFLAGDPKLLYLPMLAIVGSRKPGNAGRENARYFASNLAEAGITLISGLAVGIDGLVHQAALDAEGYTIAALGCGHNICYPRNHRTLFQDIKQKGLLISEFAPDTPVRAHQFPRRNRIISGLSMGVLVVEAAVKSGSLVTCRLAAEQGRDVFAIPGDITNPMSQGCHHLIRQGACLVETPEQILEELDWCDNFVTTSHPQGELLNNNTVVKKTADEKLLLNCLNRHPVTIDRIVNRSEMKMSLVLSLLFSLELKGLVIGSADGYFKK